MMRYLCALMIFFGGLLATGCNSSIKTVDASQTVVKKPSAVQVITARQQSISRTMKVTGDVIASNTVTIRSITEGPIAGCPWREGDTVKKGARLVEIDRPVYRQEIRHAEASLAVARARLADLRAGVRKEEVAQAAETVRELKSCTGFSRTDMQRVEKLVNSGALAEESLEKARLAYVKCETGLAAARKKHEMLKAGPTETDIAVQKALVREAEAKLDMSRARLAECIISAPFDGVVTRAHVRPGDMAQARAPLLELMETASIVLRFSVPESQSHILNIQTPVSVVFDALPGRHYAAGIIRVYPEIDSRTRTRMVEARVEGTPDLVPGMFARVTLTVESSDVGVVVPDRALLTKSSGGTVAFVVINEVAEQRKVKTGIENGSCIQVIEGIRPSDRVIVAGHEKLKNKAAVKVKPMKSSDPCSPRKTGGAPA